MSSKPYVPNKKRPKWHWIVGAIVVLFVCGGISNLVNPRTNNSTLVNPIPPTPTVVADRSQNIDVVESVDQTETPIPLPTDTVAPIPTDTAVPVPTDTVAPVPTDTAAPKDVYEASASVDNPNPAAGATVRVTGKLLKNGQPYQGAVMYTTWHYKSKDTPCDGAKTKADGTAGCSNDTGRPTVGFEVVIAVRFEIDGTVVARTSTSFTPR